MIGTLKISVPRRVRDYPSELLPSGIPSAPYQVPATALNPYAPNPPVNPRLSQTAGYAFEICNQAGARHRSPA